MFTTQLSKCRHDAVSNFTSGETKSVKAAAFSPIFLLLLLLLLLLGYHTRTSRVHFTAGEGELNAMSAVKRERQTETETERERTTAQKYQSNV